MSKKTFTILIIVILLTACAPATSLSTPTASVTPSPEFTSTSTTTFTPSPTPTQIPPVSQGTPLPKGKVISPENAKQVTLLAGWGKSSINDLTYSPDGKIFAVASSVGIYLYDALSFTEKALIETETGVQSMAFSPDGETLVMGLDDGTISLLQLPDGKLLCSLTVPYKNLGVAFSPNGKLIAVVSSIPVSKKGDYNNIIGLISVDNNTMSEESLRFFLYSAGQHGGYALPPGFSFSPDGKLLAIGGLDSTIGLLQVSDRVFLDNLDIVKNFSSEYSSQQIAGVEFSPDGNLLIAIPVSYKGMIWDVPNRKLLHLMEGQGGKFASMDLSPDGKTIATGSASNDGIILLWDTNGGVTRTLKGHTNKVNNLVFSPDGNTLASSSLDGTIRFWKTSNGELIHIVGGGAAQIESVAFSANNEFLAAGASNGNVYLRKVSNGNQFQTFGSAESGAIMSVVFSPDNKTLATGTTYAHEDLLYDWFYTWYTGTVDIWDIERGKLLSQPSKDSSVWGIALSQDGNTLAWGERKILPENDVLLWKKGQGTSRINGHDNWINGVAFSPDGESIVSGSGDKTVKLWKIYGGKLLQTFEAGEVVFCVAYSPDGKVIAAGLGNGEIKIWQVSDGSLLQTITNGDKIVFNLAFSPDGKILASASADTIAKLWNVSDGSLLSTLSGHKDKVHGIAFSPNGLYLATGSYDGLVRIWGVR